MPADSPGRWRLERTDEFESDLRRAAGKDGALRGRVEKKIEKLLENPERARGGRVGGLAGLKAERVDPYVIVWDCERTPSQPEGIVKLFAFLHHNDRRYDPSR